MIRRFPYAGRVLAGATGASPVHFVLGGLGAFVIAALLAFGYAASQKEALLCAAALAPVAAIALYRLFTRPGLEAMRLALTDPLTGLGNARHFLERLERDLDLIEKENVVLALVLFDIDDFKRVNDRFGHPAGDGVLIEVAGCLRRGGEAFRLGGDEFALLLPRRGLEEAFAVAEAVLGRIAAAQYPHGGSITGSAGVAIFPSPEIERGGLVRAADRALYHAKSMGKDCVRAFAPDAPGLPERPPLSESESRGAFLHAARSLARAAAARGLDGRSEGQCVGEIAARIAGRLGLSTEHVELVRLAGTLSDVGKLALPDDVLLKPGPLSERERVAVQRHPEIGFAMLDSLGADPVATWVRHHHERWDGRGYPARLAGEHIPLGARILFVADAFDAMTRDQTWRPRLPPNEALRELERCAGTQFDPAVVAALVAEIREQLIEPVAAA